MNDIQIQTVKGDYNIMTLLSVKMTKHVQTAKILSVWLLLQEMFPWYENYLNIMTLIPT